MTAFDKQKWQTFSQWTLCHHIFICFTSSYKQLFSPQCYLLKTLTHTPVTMCVPVSWWCVVRVCGRQCQQNEIFCSVHPSAAGAPGESRRYQRYLWGDWSLLYVQSGACAFHQREFIFHLWNKKSVCVCVYVLCLWAGFHILARMWCPHMDRNFCQFWPCGDICLVLNIF